MIVVWIGIILTAITGIILTILWIYNAIKTVCVGEEKIRERVGWICCAVTTVIVTFAFCFGLYQSNTQGGIERVVTVYDISGDVIAQCSGKFDVESSDTRIKFDDEDGERHIIYFTTGTVTIDEIVE